MRKWVKSRNLNAKPCSLSEINWKTHTIDYSNNLTQTFLHYLTTMFSCSNVGRYALSTIILTICTVGLNFHVQYMYLFMLHWVNITHTEILPNEYVHTQCCNWTAHQSKRPVRLSSAWGQCWRRRGGGGAACRGADGSPPADPHWGWGNRRSSGRSPAAPRPAECAVCPTV